MMVARGSSWCVGALCTISVACGPGSIVADGSGGSDDSSTSAPGTSTTEPPASTTTGSASADVSSGAVDDESDDDADATVEDGPIIFDVNANPDAPGRPSCTGEVNGAMQQGNIWIANSQPSSVSKIDTESMVELGRYLTRPDANGNPSRTAVSRNGDVAIANRNGGVVMIHADLDRCPDPSNTSSGAGDIKPWPDGCIGWFTPMNYASQRPVAWTAGTFDEETCRYENADVWTGGANAAIDVILLDGDTGTIEQTVPVPIAANFYGIYGGAVDSHDNFWGSQLGGIALVRVDRATFEVETWPVQVSSYGITVDRNDRIWLCGTTAARFDYPTATFETTVVNAFGGCAPGLDDMLWMGGETIAGVDIETLQVVQQLAVPSYVHGVSMDFEGRVWGVTLQDQYAYRVDPMDGTYDTFSGLISAYTYSDMTGTALAIVNGQL